MFVQRLVDLLILFFVFHCLIETVHSHTYGAVCVGLSACDAHQKCVAGICRCDPDHRRFWTGTQCAVCAQGYSLTIDRCYRSFSDLKSWNEARKHCRSQYADLSTWRDNSDQRFIKPLVEAFATLQNLMPFWSALLQDKTKKQYYAWAGATITSFNGYATSWVDPAGMKLTTSSAEWCNTLKHAGYTGPMKPSSETRKTSNGTTEQQICLSFIFGSQGSNLLCLSNEFCEDRYPFICEMNEASMTLAIASHHGSDTETLPNGQGQSNEIDFEQPPPPPPPTVTDNYLETFLQNHRPPEAQKSKDGLMSKTNMMIFAGVGALLVVGAIAGFVVMKNKRSGGTQRPGGEGSVSQGRPSFASSMGSVMDE